jgi:hypothetical protein
MKIFRGNKTREYLKIDVFYELCKENFEIAEICANFSAHDFFLIF